METVWFRNDETESEFEVVVGSAAYVGMHGKSGYTQIEDPTAEKEHEKDLDKMSYDELKHKAAFLGLDTKGKKEELLAAIQAKLAE